MKKYTTHPCIHQDEYGRLELKIFQMFFKEDTLPKFSKKSNSDSDTTEPMESWGESQGRSNDWAIMKYVRSMQESISKAGPWFARFIDWVNRRDRVSETFEKIKGAKSVIPQDEEIVGKYDGLIERALSNHQIALADKLKEQKEKVVFEQIMLKHGFDTFVSENDIIEFMKTCDRGVMINFLRNYTEFLPPEVAEKKAAADKEGLFDNYVVVHYDANTPLFRASSADEAAIKRRDPILFGLVEGSRSLYYIADWINGDDDLTLEKLEKQIGKTSEKLKSIDWDETSKAVSSFDQLNNR